MMQQIQQFCRSLHVSVGQQSLDRHHDDRHNVTGVAPRNHLTRLHVHVPDVRAHLAQEGTRCDDRCVHECDVIDERRVVTGWIAVECADALRSEAVAHRVCCRLSRHPVPCSPSLLPVPPPLTCISNLNLVPCKTRAKHSALLSVTLKSRFS